MNISGVKIPVPQLMNFYKYKYNIYLVRGLLEAYQLILNLFFPLLVCVCVVGGRGGGRNNCGKNSTWLESLRWMKSE